MEKHKKTKNKTSENTTYLIDNKTNLCQHNKLHPLINRREKLISETLYKDIETIIKNGSRKCITSEGGEDLLNQKLTNCDIDYDLYRFSDCTKSLYLEIEKKQVLCQIDIILSKY